MKKINKMKAHVLVILPTLLMGVFFTTFSFAKDYTFSWSANENQVDGYRLYYKKGGSAAVPFDGLFADEGCSPIDIGNTTAFTISGLDENEVYHFALKAYYGSEESEFTPIITVGSEDETSERTKLTLSIIQNLLLLDSDS